MKNLLFAVFLMSATAGADETMPVLKVQEVDWSVDLYTQILRETFEDKTGSKMSLAWEIFDSRPESANLKEAILKNYKLLVGQHYASAPGMYASRLLLRSPEAAEAYVSEVLNGSPSVADLLKLSLFMTSREGLLTEAQANRIAAAVAKTKGEQSLQLEVLNSLSKIFPESTVGALSIIQPDSGLGETTFIKGSPKGPRVHIVK